MPDLLEVIHGARVLVCADEGPLLATERDANDFIGAAFEQDASLVALPAARISRDFFALRTRLAGDTAQKFVNYGLRLAILGDISSYTQGSNALRDFVYESNRRNHLWFLRDRDELRSRLAEAAVVSGG